MKNISMKRISFTDDFNITSNGVLIGELLNSANEIDSSIERLKRETLFIPFTEIKKVIMKEFFINTAFGYDDTDHIAIEFFTIYNKYTGNIYFKDWLKNKNLINDDIDKRKYFNDFRNEVSQNILIPLTNSSSVKSTNIFK